LNAARAWRRTQDDLALDTLALIASVAVHGLVAWVLLGPWGGSGPGAALVSDTHPEPREVPEEQRDERARLGLERARSASINWLGIDADDPVEGDAPQAEVDQAAQTPIEGDSLALSAPRAAPGVVTPASQPRPDPESPPAPETPPAAPESPPASEPLSSPEPGRAPPAGRGGGGERAPARALEPLGPVPERASGEVVLLDTEGEDRVEDKIENTESPEPGAESDADAEPRLDPDEAAPGAEAREDDARTEDDAPSDASRSPVSSAPPGSRAPAPMTGLDGILTDREVLATAIKRALPANPWRPNQPVAGEGLEITTVMPRWSSTARMTGAPANPIVVMHFGADGRVRHADFLRSDRRVFSSGSVLVDEPLLSAMFRWRAKGERIRALDPEDRDAVVEVTIRVLFHKER